MVVATDPSRATDTESILIRSRFVLPVSQPAIEDGAVLLAGHKIARVGPWKDFPDARRKDTRDLGDSILLPGLVNAHCHLDYTNMAGLVPAQKSFTDWINLITSAKAGWNYSEYAESWLEGSHMLVRSGTTTVADYEAVPELLPDVWTATPLRTVSFLEMTGVKSRRDPQTMLDDALARIESLRGGRCIARLAPHAPYSTVPKLLRLVALASRDRHWPMSMHLSESSQEFEMFTRSRGIMFAWLQRNERDMSDCGQGSPIQHAERNGALKGTVLAIHVNYLSQGDAELLARRNVSVAHCPRSHVFFGHKKFPFAHLTRAGVNVCLGTDSLATVTKTRKEQVQLSMFDEMRAFSNAHPGASDKAVLQMSTLNGARALGLTGRIGEISKGAFADLIAIPFNGKRARVHRAVLEHKGDVSASMIDGRWAIEQRNP